MILLIMLLMILWNLYIVDDVIEYVLRNTYFDQLRNIYFEILSLGKF